MSLTLQSLLLATSNPLPKVRRFVGSGAVGLFGRDSPLVPLRTCVDDPSTWPWSTLTYPMHPARRPITNGSGPIGNSHPAGRG